MGNSNEDFAGLSAAGVTSALNSMHMSEQLRQSNVGNLLRAYKLADELEGEKPQDEFTKQQTEHQRLVNQNFAQEQESVRAARTALTEHTQQATESERLKTPAEIAQLQATTSRLTLLSPIDKKVLESKLAAANTENGRAALDLENAKALGSTPVDIQKQLLDKARRENQTVEVKLPTPDHPEGVPMRLTSQQIIEGIKSRNTLAEKAHSDLLIHQKQQTEVAASKEASKSQDEADKALEVILDPKHAANPGLQGKVNVYNAHSGAPFIYDFTPHVSTGLFGMGAGKGGPEKISIPKTSSGRQPTAREVTKDASRLGLTPKEYLDKFAGGKK